MLTSYTTHQMDESRMRTGVQGNFHFRGWSGCGGEGDGRLYGKSNGHAQKAVMVQRGQVVGTRNTSVCSENVNSVFFYWLFSIHSYKISQGSYAWVHTDICIVKE